MRSALIALLFVASTSFAQERATILLLNSPFRLANSAALLDLVTPGLKQSLSSPKRTALVLHTNSDYQSTVQTIFSLKPAAIVYVMSSSQEFLDASAESYAPAASANPTRDERLAQFEKGSILLKGALAFTQDVNAFAMAPILSRLEGIAQIAKSMNVPVLVYSLGLPGSNYGDLFAQLTWAQGLSLYFMSPLFPRLGLDETYMANALRERGLIFATDPELRTDLLGPGFGEFATNRYSPARLNRVTESLARAIRSAKGWAP